MIIETKDWTLQNDLMPGPDGGCFRVRGTVTVAHPGINPVLEQARIQDRSFALNLELKVEEEAGSFIQVVTDKEVCFELPGDHSEIPWVNILHDGKQLTTVKKILTTS